MKSIETKIGCPENLGFYLHGDFVVGQKVRATYNVTALIQIGLMWG
jgi:hypothetical protein